jgi:hypothetical protein
VRRLRERVCWTHLRRAREILCNLVLAYTAIFRLLRKFRVSNTLSILSGKTYLRCKIPPLTLDDVLPLPNRNVKGRNNSERPLTHAKKYMRAANGCPTRQKLTQKIQFPMILPLVPCIFSNGKVTKIRGICTTIPMNATPTATALALA